jgi:uncharacterized protein GlcG (DUF336 family)
MGRYKASIPALLASLFGGAMVASIGGPASAQLVEHRDLSLAAALAIATGASEACTAQGFKVSVAVVGREGQLLVHLRGDGSPPHSIENSFRRAYTALTYRRPSGEVEQRVRKDPGDQLVLLSHIMPAQGGLPIMVAGDALGAVAVSGGPGGDKDEGCARAGLEKASSLLK